MEKREGGVIVSMAPGWAISIPFSMTFITAVIMMMVMTVDGAGSSTLTYPRPRLLQVCLTDYDDDYADNDVNVDDDDCDDDEERIVKMVVMMMLMMTM